MTEPESRRLDMATLRRLAANGDTSQALAVIQDATIDPYIMPPDQADRDEFARGTFQGEIHGALGFYLLIHAADFWNNGPLPSRDHTYCNELLTHDEVRKHVFASYNVPRYYEKLTLHRVGTTSYLFECHGSGRGLVLKVLKPRYLDNPSINRQTERLAEKVRHNDKRWCPFAPYIVQATKIFVLMEFIEGPTLRDATADNLAKRPPHDYLEWVRPIARKLCEDVKWLINEEEPHLDLSPDNIILDSGAGNELVFVDFGQNYLLIDTIGTAARAHRYAAPEILDPATRSNNGLADLYSLGVLLLEICQVSGGRRDESIGNQIEYVRHAYTPLALTFESLTDRNADSRLFEERREAWPLWMESLDQRLQAELKSYGDHLLPVDWVKKLVGLRKWIWVSLDRVYELTGELADVGRAGANSHFVMLRRTAIVCRMVHVLLLVACFNALWGLRFDSLPLDRAWPGLLVAFSFTLIATMYYVNIYADLSASALDEATEGVMRLMSGLHLLPILFTMVVYPPAWPFCAAIGVFSVAINNAMTFKLARRADSLTQKVKGQVGTPGIQVPSSRAGFIQEYKSWSLLMVVYGILLTVTGFALWTDRIEDEKAYAIVVAVLNVVILWKNCSDNAPMVRAGLMWSFATMRRARRYEESHPPKTAAQIEQVMPVST